MTVLVIITVFMFRKMVIYLLDINQLVIQLKKSNSIKRIEEPNIRRKQLMNDLF